METVTWTENVYAGSIGKPEKIGERTITARIDARVEAAHARLKMTVLAAAGEQAPVVGKRIWRLAKNVEKKRVA